MKRQPMEMTPDQIRDRIERAEGAVNLYVEVPLSDLPFEELRSFCQEIREQGFFVSSEQGHPALRIYKWVIFHEIPHTIRITGEKPRLR